jgi:hypothetical protein
MVDWFIVIEGVKVVKDSASLWPQIITAVSSAGAALGGVCLAHRFTRRREIQAAADKAAAERLYITTELVFLLERYASAWTSLRWIPIEALSKDNKIPTLDLSVANGDWRVLPARQIFRIRSLEADQTALTSRIEQEKFAHYPPVALPLTLACFQTGLRAFLLAAKLRREAGLPDSAHLRDESGTFRTLGEERKLRWHKEVLERKRSKEALMILTSPLSENEKHSKRNL